MNPESAGSQGVCPNLELLAVFIFLALTLLPAAGQGPDVPIFGEGRRESEYQEQIRSLSQDLFRTGQVARLTLIKEQLKRSSCTLALPAPKTDKLAPREICTLARRAHLRIGWAYLCSKCEQWHTDLAGGFYLNSDGVAATCYHVVQPAKNVKDGCLIAADENGAVFAVTEVLAADRYTDAAVVRVNVRGLPCLSLNTNVSPGDPAYCYSDPLDRRGYFSSGIVNRFFQVPGRRKFSAPGSAAYAPTRLNVSTDWAPGSSGSAVLDGCGNAIGYVSTISAVADDERADSKQPRSGSNGATMIIFHEAVSARDLLRLMGPK